MCYYERCLLSRYWKPLNIMLFQFYQILYIKYAYYEQSLYLYSKFETSWKGYDILIQTAKQCYMYKLNYKYYKLDINRMYILTKTKHLWDKATFNPRSFILVLHGNAEENTNLFEVFHKSLLVIFIRDSLNSSQSFSSISLLNTNMNKTFLLRLVDCERVWRWKKENVEMLMVVYTVIVNR